MQLEIQEFRENAVVDKDGSITVDGQAYPAGPKTTIEFKAANDDITAAVGGSYISNWISDFLQKSMGEKGRCARFYFDKKTAVDILDPNSKTAKKKRKLLYESGFGYLCIPEDYPQDVDRLKALYKQELKAYFSYESLNPRPVEIQETLDVAEDGTPHKIKVTAIDIKVGGGVVGGKSLADALAQQAAEAQAAVAVSERETKELKSRSVTLQAIKKAKKSGQPFRNPFVGNGKRLYDVVYNSREKSA